MKTRVIRNSDVEAITTKWGNLQYLVSGANGTSEHMTLGRVTFKPGQSNPVHHHPNAEEILFVVNGEIEHTLPEGGKVRLQSGDCIVLPLGQKHQAKNIGAEEAVVLVAFNTADRKTVEE